MEDVRRFVELKERIEARIRGLREELELLEAMLRLIDEHIRSRSIRPASELLNLGKLIESREIRARSGDVVLGTVEIYERGLLVKPARPFDQGNAAFRKFLVGKVLEGLRQGDEELVREGRMRREDAFNYELRTEDGNVVELLIRNYKGDENLREILRSIRWTLERIMGGA
jgi:hypothetical protein